MAARGPASRAFWVTHWRYTLHTHTPQAHAEVAIIVVVTANAVCYQKLPSGSASSTIKVMTPSPQSSLALTSAASPGVHTGKKLRRP